jgi:ketosteroid isomerase-like protein
MKRFIVIAVAYCAVCYSAKAEDNATEETAIRQVVKDSETAWNKHDMNAFADLFTDDAEWVNVVGMVWRGKAEIKKAHQVMHETYFKNRSVWLDDMTVPLRSATITTSSIRPLARANQGKSSE